MKKIFQLVTLAAAFFPGVAAADAVRDLIALGVQPPVARYQTDKLANVNSSGNLVLPVAASKKLSVTVAGTEAASLNATGLTLAATTAGIVYTPGTLAAAGSEQGDAAAIAAKVTTVTASDGTKGVRLPAAPTVGDEYIIINTVAAVLKIYPGSGDAINATTADAAVSVAASVVSQCIATSASQWWCFEGVAP